VLPRSSESPLEPQALDSARHLLIQVLLAADDHGRLGVYTPVTDGGAPIYVHSKVLVLDDRLLRVRSSNLNDRSMGRQRVRCGPRRRPEARDGSYRDLGMIEAVPDLLRQPATGNRQPYSTGKLGLC
jgi:hypothetical protein